MHLQSVWHEPPYHVADLQQGIEREFRHKLAELQVAQPASPSPLGMVLKGAGGSGKTHLLSTLRAEAAQQGSAFIMIDMTDVNDFWETVVVGYTSSLQETYESGHSPCRTASPGRVVSGRHVKCTQDLEVGESLLTQTGVK